MWKALGEYRGPASVRCFYRYVDSTYREYVEEFTYRAYMTRVMGSYLGANLYWTDLVREREDVDAETIISDVIERAGLEVTE